ncbi:LOW QUALITY PROTEIN: hypothetical protein TorRG33x02_212560, partial [Trema orientale]
RKQREDKILQNTQTHTQLHKRTRRRERRNHQSLPPKNNNKKQLDDDSTKWVSESFYGQNELTLLGVKLAPLSNCLRSSTSSRRRRRRRRRKQEQLRCVRSVTMMMISF